MQIIFTLLVVAFCTVQSFAQSAGQIDSSFNNTGYYVHDFGFQDNLTDVKIQADQKILTCGTALNPAFAGRLLLMRNNADGTPDLSFNGTGAVLIESFNESYAYKIQVKSDGKILVAGAAADPNYLFSALVMRFNPDGSLDAAFGNNGIALINLNGKDHFAYCMQELPDHKIIIGGTYLDSSFNNVPMLMRLNENGSIDATFGNNGLAEVPVTEIDNRFNDLIVQSDGKIVAAGHLGNPITPDGQFDFDILVARFNADGSLDLSFSGNGYLTDAVSVNYSDDIFSVGLTADNKIVVTGYTTLPDFSFDVILLRYLADGQRDAGFGNAGLVQYNHADQDVAAGLRIQPDGKIVVAGTSGGFFFDNRDILLMRFNANGTPDASFGQAGVVFTEVLGSVDEANAVTLQSDGKIVVAGKSNNSIQNDACIARYHASGTTGFETEAASQVLNLFPNPISAGESLTLISADLPQIISLLDLRGVKIRDYYPQIQQGAARIALPEGLASGLYFLKIGTSNYKIVVR